MNPLELIDRELGERRVAVCKPCPAYRMTTLDPSLGLSKHFGINMEKEVATCGEFARPISGFSCGCIIELKASIKIFNCPQKKWKNLQTLSTKQ